MLRLPTLRALGAALLACASLAACNDTDGLTGGNTGAAVISTNITTNRTLFADTVYTLQGFIQVTNGAELTIQPGTVIQVTTVGVAA